MRCATGEFHRRDNNRARWKFLHLVFCSLQIFNRYRFISGELLSSGIKPHSPELFAYGFYVVKADRAFAVAEL